MQTDRPDAVSSSLTDLMTSLAIIFVLLTVLFLKQISDLGKRSKSEVYAELSSVLRESALELTPDPNDPLTLSVGISEDLLRFPVGSADLTPSTRPFVGNLFRRLASSICGKELERKIDHIVIEGHTDQSGESKPGGVSRNIRLSQRRALTVLETALTSLEGPRPDLHHCLLGLASANGRGSSQLIYNPAGSVNPERSRRVEIKIRIRSREQGLALR